jgi:hypothetical protein
MTGPCPDPLAMRRMNFADPLSDGGVVELMP